MKENTEISERISRMIESLDSNPNSFAKKLGYPRAQTIYDIVNGKSAPSYDFFKRFQISEYSEIININWLLTGRGEMLISSNVEDKNTYLNTHLNTHLSNENIHLSSQLDSTQSSHHIAAEPSTDDIYRKDSPVQQFNGANDIIMNLVEQIKEQSEEIGALRQENSALKHRLAQIAEDVGNAQSARA